MTLCKQSISSHILSLSGFLEFPINTVPGVDVSDMATSRFQVIWAEAAWPFLVCSYARASLLQIVLKKQATTMAILESRDGRLQFTLQWSTIYFWHF